MKFIRGIICLVFILSIFPPALFCEETVHTVQKGETVFSIARSFNIDRNELMRVNGISDPTKLMAGQRLIIPGAAASAAASAPAEQPRGNAADVRQYQAVRGDTFYGIARRFGLTVSALLEANSLGPDYVLKQGDVLAIPGVPAATPATVPPGPDVVPVQQAVDASVRWPVTARELGVMPGGNNGVVITGERAEPVKSLTSGTVISAGPYRGYGRVVIVQASGGYIYVYGGCESLTVREGDKVGPGMEMGRLGVDAITEKPQLFFRVYLNNTPVDPAKAPRA